MLRTKHHAAMLERVKRALLLHAPNGVPVYRLAAWLATDGYPEPRLAGLIRSWAWPDRSAATGIELRGEHRKRVVCLVERTRHDG